MTPLQERWLWLLIKALAFFGYIAVFCLLVVLFLWFLRGMP